MKINEILLESQDLQEGPLMNKIGTAVGKAAGTAAKGIGAVAGGAMGAWDAMKKGFRAGKATVAGGGDDEPDTSAASSGGTQAAASAATEPGGGVDAQPSAQDINKAGPKGTAPAKNLTGTAKMAADKTAAATQDQDAVQAGQTVYAQVKANIDKLDKKGKQRILQLLQKSIQQTPAQPAQADAGAAAMGQMAKQLSTPAKSSTGGTVTQTPTGVKHTAKQAQPTAVKPTAKQPLKVVGKKAAKPSPLPTAQTASKENLGKMIAEGFSLYRK